MQSLLIHDMSQCELTPAPTTDTGPVKVSDYTIWSNHIHIGNLKFSPILGKWSISLFSGVSLTQEYLIKVWDSLHKRVSEDNDF